MLDSHLTCSLNFSLLEIFKVVCLLFNYQGSILRHFSTSKIIACGLVTNFQQLSVLLFCVVLCLKRQLLKDIIHQVSLSTLFCICFKSFSYQRSDHFSVFPPSLVSDLIRISSCPVFVNMFFQQFDQIRPNVAQTLLIQAARLRKTYVLPPAP